MSSLLRTIHADRTTDSQPARGDIPPVTVFTDDGRYAAIVARDASMDGTFYFAVRTTGVVCKPSCGARTPKRENVSFHGSVDDAIVAGFRPCKRCRPQLAADTLHRDVVTAVCRLIDDAVARDQPAPTLEVLAHKSGFSPFHLHRMFRKATGITPRAYATGARANRVRATLEESRTISEAIHAAGYGSSSRFYERATQRLGMTPTQLKGGGRHETIRFAIGATSLGAMLVAATDKGVCAIQLADDPDVLICALEARFPNATLVGDDDAFSTTVAQVVAFVEAPHSALALPLDIRGTAFQERVWTALTAIAPGRTVTYTELAQAIGQPNAVRAVASACAANDIAIAIPCHRVVRSNGELSGYRWGVERKDALLRREGAR